MPKCPDCDFENRYEDTMAVHRKITGHSRPLTDAEREELMMKEWQESSRLIESQDTLINGTAEEMKAKREALKKRLSAPRDEAKVNILPDHFHLDEVQHPEIGTIVYVTVSDEYKIWDGKHWQQISGFELARHVEEIKEQVRKDQELRERDIPAPAANAYYNTNGLATYTTYYSSTTADPSWAAWSNASWFKRNP